MNVAIIIIIMKNCNDFQVHRCIEYMRELEAAKDQGSCAWRVNPRGSRVSAFAERVREHVLLCVRGGRGMRNSLCG